MTLIADGQIDLYYSPNILDEYQREAIKMTESKWIVSKWLREGEQKGEQIGELKRGKETAHEMFISGEDIAFIRKYSKLQDNDLADVLRSLPKDIQTKYDLLPN